MRILHAQVSTPLELGFRWQEKGPIPFVCLKTRIADVARISASAGPTWSQIKKPMFLLCVFLFWADYG